MNARYPKRAAHGRQSRRAIWGRCHLRQRPVEPRLYEFYTVHIGVLDEHPSHRTLAYSLAIDTISNNVAGAPTIDWCFVGDFAAAVAERGQPIAGYATTRIYLFEMIVDTLHALGEDVCGRFLDLTDRPPSSTQGSNP